MFRRWLNGLDDLLRGNATRLEVLRQGQVAVRTGDLLLMNVLLGMVTGFCVGWFALVNRQTEGLGQVLASTLKVPALFLLTFAVTLPSLYVFNALIGSRLSAAGVTRLLLASLAIVNAILASFGPILAFFSLTTESYGFMVLFNVFLFGMAGLIGLVFLLRTLQRLTWVLDQELTVTRSDIAMSQPSGDVPVELSSSAAGALEAVGKDPVGARVRLLFQVWVSIFAVVGMQMAWVLRPLIGDPSQPFTWFRPRESNFFQSVLQTLAGLLGR
jgi:hypothetical protein